MNDYQLLVIGAGPGGYTAALHAARLGLKAAVVEAREAGGTCVNRGCVPTKTLLQSAELYRAAAEGAAIGIHVEGLRADMDEIFAYKRHISETLSQGIEGMLKSAKVPLLRGRACITAPHCVEITAADGTVSQCTADNILVATGAAPMLPPIPGIELPGVLTSDDILESDGHMFQSLVIIGGGVIGIEFACFYAPLGCDVTLIEAQDRLLHMMDRELGQNLGQLMNKQNIRVLTGAMVKNIEQDENGMHVTFEAKGTADTVSAEAVICAIGRRACCAGVFAEGLEPEMNGSLIRVNERYETSIPGVFAIGDVACPVQFAHVASAQAQAFAEMLVGEENHINMDLVPSCVHCRPEIAVVGLSEAEAKAAGIPVKVGKCVMGGNARTLVSAPGRSFMKVVAHGETGELLGAQFMCTNASDMIAEIGEAIANPMTAPQLMLAMRPHPTYEEALNDALTDLIQKSK